MNNNQKTSFQISSDASTDQVFKLLDALQSDKEDEIDELVNDFDTKCIAPEEIELTDNPGNVSALRLEVNTHVADQGTIHTKEIESNKKRKKKPEESTPITWKRDVPPHSREYCFLEGRITNQFEESASSM